MNVLLIRPDPGNDRFGLGTFFRVEPLGLEYIAAALEACGATPHVVDERLARKSGPWLRRTSPEIVGISCPHALEYDGVIATARRVRRLAPEAFIVVGGHAAATYPQALEVPEIDAICVDDGEEVFPALVEAVSGRRPLSSVPALRLRTPAGWIDTEPLAAPTALDRVPRPARERVAAFRRGYHCLLFRPVWLVETARGCSYRCRFCSVWQLYGRTYRERSIGSVVEDLAATGEHVFIVDDLFWNNPERSLELARALRRKGVRKRWLLVQTRTDLACRQPELLEAWRPLAQDFDIFFGLESAGDQGLEQVDKDASIADTLEAARIARSLRYGVTGNFVVDPDWDASDFARLWDFVADHGFHRAGYSILTPLPGTAYFRELASRLAGQPWFKYDMHHVLWEPRLGTRRFFELYAETWRRSILNLQGEKSWWQWARQVRPTQIPYLTRALLRTQRMMRPEAYLAENDIGEAERPATRRVRAG